MIPINNILLPTDFSEPSSEAATYAVEFARRFGSTLHLFHVIEDPLLYVPMFDSSPMPSKEEFEKFTKTRLDEWLLPEGANECEIIRHFRHGNPFVETVRYAKSQKVDLIVMGTHGRGLASHLLMGSVAEKVVRKAHCPVLTVRPGDHRFVHPTA